MASDFPIFLIHPIWCVFFFSFVCDLKEIRTVYCPFLFFFLSLTECTIFSSVFIYICLLLSFIWYLCIYLYIYSLAHRSTHLLFFCSLIILFSFTSLFYSFINMISHNLPVYLSIAHIYFVSLSVSLTISLILKHAVLSFCLLISQSNFPWNFVAASISFFLFLFYIFF